VPNEFAHASPGLEIGVYVLLAPGARPPAAARRRGHIVLDGRGVLELEGKPVGLERGQAVFVPAGARHAFTGYEG
jgi:mannose-6-phosphate isomerase-like protein (cupin superfamily)